MNKIIEDIDRGGVLINNAAKTVSIVFLLAVISPFAIVVLAPFWLVGRIARAVSKPREVESVERLVGDAESEATPRELSENHKALRDRQHGE